MNIKSQYALAFCVYLVRVGSASTSKAAKDLGISSHFLAQVVRKLRIANVLDVRRGPGGGYSFKNDLSPTVGSILEAVDNPWTVADLAGADRVADQINQVLREIYDQPIEDYSSAAQSVEATTETTVRS